MEYHFLQVVLFLPALCRKMGVPYCIIKGKARLGRLVRRKTCSVVALTQVQYTSLLKIISQQYIIHYLNDEEYRANPMTFCDIFYFRLILLNFNMWFMTKIIN